MRRSYMSWTPVTDQMPEKANREYLVAVCRKGSTQMKIATFYNALDKVQLEKNSRMLGDSITKEERLLRTIGVLTKQVVVPKTGFYEIVETGGNTDDHDCTKELSMITNYNIDGNPTMDSVFWAELPQPPYGFEHPSDILDRHEEDIEKIMNERTSESIAKLNEIIDASHEAKTIRGMMLEKHKENNEPEYRRGIMIKYTDNDIITACGISQILIKVDEFINTHYSRNNITKLLTRSDQTELTLIIDDIKNYIKSIYPINDETYLIILKLTLTTLLTEYDDKDVGYYYHNANVKKNRLYKSFVKLNEGTMPEKFLRIIFAENIVRIPGRIHRLNKMVELNAPVIILQNEFRMVYEALIMFLAEITEPVTPERAAELFGANEGKFGGKYDFGSMYGIDVDGTPCDYDPAIGYSETEPVDDNCSRAPRYGRDRNGTKVRYNANRHVWQPGHKTFRTHKTKDTPAIKYSIDEYIYFDNNMNVIDHN